MTNNQKIILKIILFIAIFLAILTLSSKVLADDLIRYGIFFGVGESKIEVTNLNKNDVLNDGKITFTPAEGEKAAVLTFNGECEIPRMEITGLNNLEITSGTENAEITLTGPLLIGTNGGKIAVTIKGNSDLNTTLTIKPAKDEKGFNTFRPIAIRMGNTLKLDKGAILRDSNIANLGGGMVNVAANATFEMIGGSIINSNVSSESYDNINSHLGRGGAVYVEEKGKFIMSGGSIEKCSATVAGGAIFSIGEINITGGLITECFVNGIEDNGTVKAKGGAIYIFRKYI